MRRGPAVSGQQSAVSPERSGQRSPGSGQPTSTGSVRRFDSAQGPWILGDRGETGCQRLVRAVLVALWACAFGAYAAPVEHWMERANKFYEQNAYDSAAVFYEKIAESGLHSAPVYYNLGNVYYRQHKLGLAILSYERARRLAPNDADITANIKFANANIVDKIPEPELGFFGALLFRLHNLLSLHTQLWVLFGLLMALSLLLVLWLFASRNGRLWAIYLSSIVLALTVAMGASVGYKIHQAESSISAIVLQPSVDARSEPNGAKILFTAHEGTKFRIVKALGDWAFVGLPNGSVGWVEKSALGEI